METTTKKQPYGKIDNKILIQAMGEGKTMAQAGRLAGSKAHSEDQISSSVSVKIKRDAQLKKSIIQKMEEVREAYLDSMVGEDLTKVPVNQRAITLAILTDKIQLLKGDPTMVIASIPRMVFDDSLEEKEAKKEKKKEGEATLTVEQGKVEQGDREGGG